MQKVAIGVFSFLLVIAILLTALFLSKSQHYDVRLMARGAGQLEEGKQKLKVTTITTNQIQIKGTKRTPEKLFNKRRKAVRAACRKTGIKKLEVNAPQLKDVYKHMIVDDAHKLIYCYVPKAACTSWKRVMLLLTGNTDTRDPHNLRNHLMMSDLSNSERQKRMKSYKKFMVHREPLGRLLSAYLDKFDKEDKMRLTYGRKIIRRYRRKASMHSLQYGDDVRFSEFARFVADSAKSVQWMNANEHWRPQVKLCQPCTIDYDYYSEMETVESDAETILKLIRAPDSIKFPHSHNTNASQKLSLFYSDLGRDLIQRLLAVYKDDFAIFGYKKRKDS